MKVLFVSSANSGKINSIISSQAYSFFTLDKGVKVEFYAIEGSGLFGYLKNVFLLHYFLRKNCFEVVHAHYSLSGIVAYLAGSKPLVVSLMGSDVNANFFEKKVTHFFAKRLWCRTIVKSVAMKNSLKADAVEILPNGVSLVKFKPLNRSLCLEKLGWVKKKRHILFAANPARTVKNFELFLQAYKRIQVLGIELEYHVLENVEHDDMPMYMNAAEIVCLTSIWEGSPNVIKEAMACNIPIVSTNVGDVEWLFGDSPGHFIVNNPTEELIARNLIAALNFGKVEGRTKGRERLRELELDSTSVANKIFNLYQSILQ